jgi:transaldolase
MADNRLKQLGAAGVSVWLDYLDRDMLRTGKLRGKIDDYGLSGLTSNPSIFQEAVTSSTSYDEQLRQLVGEGTRDEKELFLAVAMRDIADAADTLKPVYERTEGRDGFVSIEVSPDLAYRTDETIQEAQRLFTTIGRKNVLIKVPATPPGLAAIERLTAEGINVNITLLFSVPRYEEVADAYLKGLEARVAAGTPVAGIASVASFCVSRVDTLVDSMLDGKLAPATSGGERDRLRALRGRAAVANARLAYSRFGAIFSGSRFAALAEKGARIQRLLWGSTSAKDPAYSDVKYVEELIGPDLVNTMPEKTMHAFLDHGTVRRTIDEDPDTLAAYFMELATIGIRMEEVAVVLEKEGVKKFSDSYFDLLGEIAEKRDRFAK